MCDIFFFCSKQKFYFIKLENICYNTCRHSQCWGVVWKWVHSAQMYNSWFCWLWSDFLLYAESLCSWQWKMGNSWVTAQFDNLELKHHLSLKICCSLTLLWSCTYSSKTLDCFRGAFGSAVPQLYLSLSREVTGTENNLFSKRKILQVLSPFLIGYFQDHSFRTFSFLMTIPKICLVFVFLWGSN